jgi:hypothetical protein
MEQILNDTQDIYPQFWKNYYKEPSNQTLEIDMNTKKTSTITEFSKVEKTKLELAKMFDLLLFLTSIIEQIYLTNCASYMDILNNLSIHASLSRELNILLVDTFKINKKDVEILDKIIEDFIDITTILTDSLTLESDKKKDGTILFKKKVEESKQRSKKLYLKIISSI